MNNRYLLAAIVIAALITLALRAFPFLLISVARRHEALFAFLGAVMPPGIMAILAIYAASTLNWRGAGIWVSAVALLVLMLIDYRLRRPVVSLCIALAIYVAGQSLVAGAL